MLEELYKYHKDWFKIAFKFVKNKEDAEDIIQNTYLKLFDSKIELKDIKYKKEINRYFMYIVIRNISFQFLNKKIKYVNIDDLKITEEPKNEKEECLQKLLIKIDDVAEKWNSYDKNIFEIYMYSGLSLRQLSYGTDKKAKRISNIKFIGNKAVKNGINISVSSMFNTIKRCKAELKKELGEDFEDYFNNNFDKI